MKAFIFIALFSYLGVAECLRCFECNSKVDSVCADPFSLDSQTVTDAFLKTCNATDKDGNPSFCRKTKMWFKIDDQVRIHRDCGYLRRDKYLCYQQRFEDHIVDVCQCDEDNCNGASQTSVAAGVVLAAMAAAFARL